MNILVDGHNLLHLIPSLKRKMHDNHSAAKEELVALLLSNFRKRNDEITIFFDNQKAVNNLRQNYRGIHIAYAPPGKTADDLIVAETEKLTKSNSAAIVYTNDRGLKQRVSQQYIYVKSNSDLARDLKRSHPASGSEIASQHPPEKNANQKLNQNEVDEWMKLFADNGDPDLD
jgi:predicted RNA-binding protein with PIN domain